jgi:NAD(P)-dependent dehydrogenase (short-subunit alcohol dehydrogenase family)
MLKNKKIVIIGGSSGIGFAIAKAALEEYAEVIIISRSVEKLNQAKKKLDNKVEVFVGDIRNELQLQQIFEKIGTFDHLQLTASEISFGRFDTLSIQDAKAMYDSKFWGPYQAAKAAIPYLKSTGSITFYSGAYSQMPKTPGAAVAASINSAVEGLSRALAVELAPVRVNTITPGVVDTELFANMGMDKTQRESFFNEVTAGQAIKRAAKPDEIALTALYLMKNTYSTANTLFVDGGLTFR